ncbi:MAG: EAL domain-containing protein [Rhodocyclaceae bacterium]
MEGIKHSCETARRLPGGLLLPPHPEKEEAAFAADARGRANRAVGPQVADAGNDLPDAYAVFDALTVGILLSSKASILWLNPALGRFLGYAPGDLCGLPLELLLAGEQDAGELLAEIGAAAAGAGQYRADLPLQHRGGGIFWARLSVQAAGTEGQRTLVWVIEDISAERGAQEALQRATREIYGILNTAVMGITLLRNRRIDRCNSRMEELFGFGPGEMTGCSTRVWYASEDAYQFVGADVYADLRAGREAFREREFQRRDGSLFWGRMAGRALDPADPYAGSVWIIEDLTVEHQAKEEQLLAQKVFEVSSEAIMITNTKNRIVSVNAAFQEITGYSEAEVKGQDPRMMASGRHDPEFFRAMWLDVKECGHWAGEIWDRRKDGKVYPKWLNIDSIRGCDGSITHHVAVFSDITDRKTSEERIRYLAHHDSLTGLPNRLTLLAHLKQALARSQRSASQLALMFIDLDNFKTINDTLGHHVGDLLLCEVARRITGVVRASDIVARIGGDEFVVVLEGAQLSGAACLVAQKIIDRLGESYGVEQNELHTTPSIGISIYPDDGADSESLMKNADTAMYHAKSAGRNNFQFYAVHMNAAATVRLHLEQRLRSAVALDELRLVYQPQVDLASGKPAGVEALVRWHSPDLGIVSPADFIPLAEETGLIMPIGEWVLRTACRDARAWLDAGIVFGRVSVNISPRQFQQHNFPERVEAILAETGLPGSALELEITESTVMETADVAIAMLHRLKALGLTLAIDDFGTGYSSLAYLKRFPVDRLKIDRSFVIDIETDPSDAAIACAVITLAHSLGLDVVAEGVETAGQVSFLRQQGCDSAQGFFYCRPVAAGEAVEFCRPKAGKVALSCTDAAPPGPKRKRKPALVACVC